MTEQNITKFFQAFSADWPDSILFFDLNLKSLFKTNSTNKDVYHFMMSQLETNLDLSKIITDQLKNNKKYLHEFKIDNSFFKCEFFIYSINFENIQQHYILGKIIDDTNYAAIVDQQLKMITLDKIKELAEISAGIGHEINNPLTVILAKSQFLKNQIEELDFTNKQKCLDALSKVDQYSDRIAKIIKSLKNFSRHTENDTFEPVILSVVIDDVLSLLLEKIKSNGIQITYENTMPALHIICISSEIMQILVNLIKNAIDAVEGKRSPWIKISVNKISSDKIQICIQDSGDGVPDQDIEKIFKSFYTTKAAARGTGLGLSISKNLAEKNLGSLYIDKSISQSCFVLELKTTLT